MIPRLLEKAILNGWADYRKVSHAFGSFGAIPIPNNSTVIIVDIKWNPFLNSIRNYENLEQLTYREFFKYSEYQLKIDGKKSLNYLHFRNEFKWRWTDNTIGNFKLDEVINLETFRQYFLPEHSKPIQQNVYFVCEEYIKITITRNTFIKNVTANMGSVNDRADEKKPPNGVFGIKLLDDAKMSNGQGDTQVYVPVSNLYDPNLITNPRTKEGYTQDISDESIIQTITTDEQAKLCDFPYAVAPLIEFGIVVINNNHFDKIKNS